MAKYIDDMRVGDEYTLVLEFPTGTNITGYKFWFTLKSDRSLSDNDAELQITSTTGDTTGDDAVNGIKYLVVPSDIMKSLPAGEYYYDVQVKSPGASGLGIKTLLPKIFYPDDKITVYPEVTQAVA